MSGSTKVTKFTVERDRWYRGRGDAFSALLRSDDSMCCLGFLAKACGAADDEIEGRVTPKVASSVRWPRGFLRATGAGPRDSAIAGVLMELNDDPDIDEESRESMLARTFLDNFGIEVEFK